MKQKDILFLIVSTFLLVIAWIGFNIFHNATTSTIPAQTNIQIEPIAPNFDVKTFAALKQRERIIPLYQVKNIPSPTQPPIPTPTLFVQPSPILSPTPTGTASATITPTIRITPSPTPTP